MYTLRRASEKSAAAQPGAVRRARPQSAGPKTGGRARALAEPRNPERRPPRPMSAGAKPWSDARMQPLQFDLTEGGRNRAESTSGAKEVLETSTVARHPFGDRSSSHGVFSTLLAQRPALQLGTTINAYWESHTLCVLWLFYTQYSVAFHEFLKVQSTK